MATPTRHILDLHKQDRRQLTATKWYSLTLHRTKGLPRRAPLQHPTHTSMSGMEWPFQTMMFRGSVWHYPPSRTIAMLRRLAVSVCKPSSITTGLVDCGHSLKEGKEK